LSDIDIALRLAILMRYRCTALHRLSWLTPHRNSKRPAARTQQRAGSAMCADRSFYQNTANFVFGSQADKTQQDYIYNREKPRGEKFDVATMQSASHYP
jgi:hypothetical protein